MNLASIFLAIKVGASDAALIISKADFFVQAAESAAKDTTMTGAQKLDAVKSALVADLQSIRPDLAANINALWPEISALIAGLVTLYHALSAFGFVAKIAATVAEAV